MYTQDACDYEPIAIYNAKISSLNCRQGKFESVNNYFTRLTAVIDVLDYYKCSLGDDMAMVHFEMKHHGLVVEEDKHIPGDPTYEVFRESARDRFWATAFIVNADPGRFHVLKTELANSYVKGTNEYPGTLLTA